MALKRVRLELGRTDDFPEGNPNHGYEFVVPLAEDGRIDLADWEREPQICTVVRFSGFDEDERGQLIRTAAGEWAFSYEPGEADDEAVYRLGDHAFMEGNYVTITEHDGRSRPFRVVGVADWHPRV
jgi:hypothetical protein